MESIILQVLPIQGFTDVQQDIFPLWSSKIPNPCSSIFRATEKFLTIVTELNAVNMVLNINHPDSKLTTKTKLYEWKHIHLEICRLTIWYNNLLCEHLTQQFFLEVQVLTDKVLLYDQCCQQQENCHLKNRKRSQLLKNTKTINNEAMGHSELNFTWTEWWTHHLGSWSCFFQKSHRSWSGREVHDNKLFYRGKNSLMKNLIKQHNAYILTQMSSFVPPISKSKQFHLLLLTSGTLRNK